MIHYNSSTEQTNLALLASLKKLGIASLLRESGIRKNVANSKFSTCEVFKFLFMLVFHQKNLYRFLDSKRSDQAVSKNTYYRFLGESTFNWRGFLLKTSWKVITSISTLTRPKRIKVFVLDDSLVSRNRSKSVELLARVFDHSTHKYLKGFTMLALGWTDGYSFIPVDFAMMSSATQSNRYNEANPKIDKRTHGSKRRSESICEKPQIAVKLIDNALKQGIVADYVLMDTWFTHEPLIAAILELGVDVIGMVKKGKQKYTLGGCAYDLKELYNSLSKKRSSTIRGSAVVATKTGILVKIVFVKNRSNAREWLAILSTNIHLSDDEIIRIYGNRWSIEVFFKSIKSFMKLGSEFQCQSYDAMISHTTIVYTRYIVLEWLRREEKDPKTFGDLFYEHCDEVRDIDLTTSLQSLMGLLVDHINGKIKDINELKNQLLKWIDLQATFIKALFTNLVWES